MSQGISHENLIFTALSGALPDMTTSLAALIEITATNAAPPTRVRLLPIGQFEPRGHGIKLRVESLSHAQEIVQASLSYAGAQDIPFDYDHQLTYGAKDGVGGRAPASGWIKSLSAEADGIWAQVEWTQNAAAAIKAKEYKYISPVVGRTKDGKVLLITSVSLTNMPAVDDLFRLAASRQPPNKKDFDMDLTALAALLGLVPTATLDEIHTALSAQLVKNKAAQDELSALRAALGAQDQTTALSAVTALKASSSTDATMVALMSDTQARLAVLSAERAERFVDDAIGAGKVTPAQRDHYIALMASNETLAKQIIGAAPTVIGQGQLLGAAPPPTLQAALSADQKAVADVLGIDHAAYLATLNQKGA